MARKEEENDHSRRFKYRVIGPPDFFYGASIVIPAQEESSMLSSW